MLNFEFLKKGLGRVSTPHFVYNVSKKMFYVLLTDQISLSDYLYFLRYWAVRVLQLFVSQAVTS